MGTTSPTVSVIFTGNSDELLDTLSTIGDSASESAAKIAEPFSGASDDISRIMSEMSARVNEILADVGIDPDETAKITAPFDEAGAQIRTVMSETVAKVDETLAGAGLGPDDTERLVAPFTAASAQIKAVMDETVASVDEKMATAGVGAGGARVEAAAAAGATAGGAGAATTEAEAADASVLGGVGSKGSRAGQEAAAGSKEEAAAAKAAKAAEGERAKALESVGNIGKWSFLAIAAGIGVSVDLASKFQSASEHLVTDAGESQSALASVQSGMLSVSQQTGTSAMAIEAGMYHIESAGYHGAAGLKVLQTAAEGAKVGNADLDTVAKTLTGTMNAYNIPAREATSVMNQLIATVGAGDMSMEDLASSLGNVAPVAAAAHVSLAQVGGAIATMTSQNMSAQQATQDLAFAIRALQAPNNVAIQEMAQFGLNSNTLSKNLGKEGLTGTLQEVTKAILSHMGPSGMVLLNAFNQSTGAAKDMQIELANMPPAVRKVADEFANGKLSLSAFRKALPANEMPFVTQFAATYTKVHEFNSLLAAGSPAAQTYNASLQKVMGGATGLNTALMITGGRMATFTSNVSAISNAAAKGGNSVLNWSKIQATFSQQLDVIRTTVEDLAIKLGTALIPVLEKVVAVTARVVEWFAKHKDAAIALGLAISGVLAVAMTVYAEQKAAKFIKSTIAMGKELKQLEQGAVSLAQKLLHIGSPSSPTSTSSGTSGAQGEQVQGIGQASQTSAEQVTGLGSAADTAQGQIASLGSAADTSAGQVTGLGSSSQQAAETIAASSTEAETSVTAIGTSAERTSETVATSSAEMELSLTAVGDSATTTGDVMEEAGTVGGEGMDSMLGPIGLLIMAGTMVAEHWKTISKDLVKVWGLIKEGVAEAFGWVKDHLSIVIPVIVGIVTGPIGLLVYELVKHWGTVKHDVAAAWDWVKDHLGLIIPAIVLLITGPIGLMVALIATHWHKIESDAKAIWGDIESFLKGVPGDILRFFENFTLIGLLVSHWKKIESDATSAWNTVVSFIKGIPGKIIAVFTGAGTWLVNAGVSLLTGLWHGMDSEAGTVLKKAEDIGKKVISVMTHPWKVFSPSKATAEKAAYLMQGISVGMKGALDPVLADVDRIGASISAEFGKLSGQEAGHNFMAEFAHSITATAHLATNAFAGVVKDISGSSAAHQFISGMNLGAVRPASGAPLGAGSSVTHNYNLNNARIEASDPGRLGRQLQMIAARRHSVGT